MPPSISQSASDSRKQQYIDKYGSLPSGVTMGSTKKQEPAKPVVDLKSRTYEGSKPSTRQPEPTPQKTTPGKTPAKQTPQQVASTAKDPAQVGKENAQTFMSIIGNMPPETKNRYLSAYTDFLKLPAEQQASYLSGLEQMAKDIVAPKIEQDRTRLKEDFDYELQKREREKNDLKSTFDKVVGYLDTNKARDIAKENTTAAKVMQNVGNTAFVTGVAGSGIFSRRTYYVRENLQNNVEDINVDYNQKVGDLALKKGQAERTIDSEIDRLYQLNERDLSDLDQTQKEDELALFFELAGNEFGKKTEQNTQLLEAGAGAETDFAAGGSDGQRKARHNKEVTTKRLDAERAREDQAVQRYKQLFDLTKALESLGRRAEIPGIRAEMDRLSPTVQIVLDEARNGYTRGEYAENQYKPRSFMGSSGSGIGDLSDFENRWSTNFYSQYNMLYRGLDGDARQRMTQYLQDNADTIRMYQPS